MSGLLGYFIVLCLAHSGFAKEAHVEFRITGLFQPDRVADLERQAGSLTVKEDHVSTEVKLVKVNYELSTATFSFDPDSVHFRKKTQEQILQILNGLVRKASRSTFQLFPLSTLDVEQLVMINVEVAGLDCKGCAFGAYRAIAMKEGVERAVVSFKDGCVKVWIDPRKTNRESLVEWLKKAEVELVETDSNPQTPKK